MRARDTQRKSDLRQVAESLEIFYNDYQRYPGSNGGQIVACPFDSEPNDCAWGGANAFQDDRGTVYFRELPSDPRGGTYFYRTINSNQAYQLYAHLENSEDTDCISGVCVDSDLPDDIPIPNCGASTPCNFSITSANVNASEEGEDYVPPEE